MIPKIRRIHVFFCLFLAFACGLHAEITDLKPTVILISVDGFRYDYFGKTPMPNFDWLIAHGARAQYMIPSFPTKTFPNHYTIVTGLYPAHHGIIANNMWDPDLQTSFKTADRKQVKDRRWWGGEPIWVTAQKQGQKTAPLYWPGSEADVQGIWADYREDFNEKTTPEYRVDKLMSWLDQPQEQRPTFLTLYFEYVDEAGHDYGPGSAQVAEALQKVDHALGYLREGLRSRGIQDKVNIIVVSDHGMAPTARAQTIVLDDYVDLSSVMVVDWSPVLAIRAKDGDDAALYKKLRQMPHVKVYRKDEIPARFHFSGNKRITPIIGIADVGWTIASRASLARHPEKDRGGNHGYDNLAPEMRAIFLAEGPAFKPHSRLKPFPNVDVYSLLAYLLNVKPARNDGTIKPFLPVLHKRGKATVASAN